MSDLGSETASASMKIAEKTVETTGKTISATAQALQKMLGYLFSNNERTLKSLQIKSMKNELNEKEAKEFVNNARGYAKMKKLLATGDKIIPIGMSISQEQLKKFNEYSKISGLAYSTISDKRVIEDINSCRKELDEINLEAKDKGLLKEQVERRKVLEKRLDDLEKVKNNCIIMVREKDAELCTDITQRMNRDIRLDDIDHSIDDLSSRRNLTKEEKDILNELKKEKKSIGDEYLNSFNKDKTDDILSNGENNEVVKANFERALTKVTDQDSYEAIYIADINNPQNYIKAYTYPMEDKNGKTFTCTEYDVYNNGEKQKCDEFKHGKFTHYSDKNLDNSTEMGETHWNNIKDEMKNKSGLSDDVYIFTSEEKYKQYTEKINTTKNKVTHREDTISYEGDSESYKHCTDIINNLKGQLSEHNLVLNEQRQLCKADSLKVVQINKNMNDDERMACVSGMNIAKQISNYEKMNDIQKNIEMTKNEKLYYGEKYIENGMPESMKDDFQKKQQEYQQRIDSFKEELKATQDREKQLIDRQVKIESIKDMKEATYEKDDYEIDKMNQNTNQVEIADVKDNNNEHYQSKEQWENDIKDNRSNKFMADKSNVRSADRGRE